MARVIVVGAGISGLASALFLERAGMEVRVLEARSVAGGNVRTDREQGYVLDRAANGWLDNEPAMGRLLDHLGLADRTVPASGDFETRWIHADGRMQPAPLGPGAMLSTRLLSWRDKLRLLGEPLVSRGPEEQTVGELAARRLGWAMVDRMIGPMVAGIFAADPFEVSLRAAFPRMAEIEREYGSLFLAMALRRRGGAPRGHLQTLPGGAGALTDALVARLGDHLETERPVRALERSEGRWRVCTDRGSEEADSVVLACPGYRQAELVGPLHPRAGAALDSIPYSPIAVVMTGWTKDAWARPPEGFGVLMSRDTDMGGVLGTVFTSCLFPEQAPPGRVLLRTMVGGAVHPEVALAPDEVVVERAMAAHLACFGRPSEGPELVRVVRHTRGIPQYRRGHSKRVAEVTHAEDDLPGLFFTGNHLEGIGVKDCVRAGEDVARRVVARSEG